MFEILESLTKATLGVVVKTPLSVVADVVTLGGTLTDRDQTYTGEALEEVMDNVNDATGR